ncbi:hypothetical protein CXG81DRAFT_6869, partial [Caulochytrium protostelioides]
MELLYQGYSAFKGEKGQVQTGGETVDRICGRLAHATRLEDRRAAVQALKGLARTYKLEVGTRGMPAVLKCLREDRMDTALVKAGLETLTNVGASPGAGVTAPLPPAAEEGPLGTMFCEIFLKDQDHVSLVLELLVDTDFYVRFAVLQLLTTLCQNQPTQLQSAVLTSPLGISRLLDLIDDQREIVRNEGMLLLMTLTEHNAEIQKIIAFENAFERLLAIVTAEGGLNGDMLVQDCLQLTHNLLNHNVSNQTLFRESRGIHQLVQLFTVELQPDFLAPADGGPDRPPRPTTMAIHDLAFPWNDQVARNTVVALRVMGVLLERKNPSAATNRDVMRAARALEPVAALAVGVHVPCTVRTQSFLALRGLVSGHPALQDTLAAMRIAAPPRGDPAAAADSDRGTPPSAAPPRWALAGPPRGVLSLIVRTALLGTRPSKATPAQQTSLRAAAATAFVAFLAKNPEGQAGIVHTLLAPLPDLAPSTPRRASAAGIATAAADDPDDDTADLPSPGHLLLLHLLKWREARKDPLMVWLCAALLGRCIDDDEEAMRPSLMNEVMAALVDYHEKSGYLHAHAGAAPGAHHGLRPMVAYLSLLVVWLHQCPRAGHTFLAEASSISFLVEQITRASGLDPLVQGLAAYILAQLTVANLDAHDGLTRRQLKQLISSRIGADLLTARVDRLLEDPRFTRTHPDYVLPSTPSTLDPVALGPLATANRIAAAAAAAATDPAVAFFDEETVALIRSTAPSLMRTATTPDPAGHERAGARPGHDGPSGSGAGHGDTRSGGVSGVGDGITGAAAAELLREKDAEIVRLADRLRHLESQLTGRRAANVPLDVSAAQRIAALEEQLGAKVRQLEAMETEQNDLLVCLAEQELEMQMYRRRLRAYGEVIESDPD